MSNHATSPLQFLVFSFNRGDFLNNCVESIQQCAPQAGITIWDDNSDDPLTLQTLNTLSAQCDIRQPDQQAVEYSKLHGGLYGNMQAAIENLSGNPLICTIQDDMQVVRPISAPEIERWQSLYHDKAFKGFFQPGFIKRAKESITYVPALDGYHIDRLHRSAGAFYSDLFLIQRNLLMETNWKFYDNEAKNEQQARQHFSQMIFMKNPFIAWLPGVPAWRGRKRTWALRFAERQRKCGLYPFKIMDADTVQPFCERPSSDIPLAERYLTFSGDSLPRPWFYHPLQRRNILRQLNKLELHLGRRFGGCD